MKNRNKKSNKDSLEKTKEELIGKTLDYKLLELFSIQHKKV